MRSGAPSTDVVSPPFPRPTTETTASAATDPSSSSASPSSAGTVRYACLSHSSLSQTSTACVGVRSLHCSDVPPRRRRRDDDDDGGDEEKKTSGIGGRRYDDDEKETELRVEASLSCPSSPFVVGRRPLSSSTHAATIARTDDAVGRRRRFDPAAVGGNGGEGASGTSASGGMAGGPPGGDGGGGGTVGHPRFLPPAVSSTYVFRFDAKLDLPTRWRDLGRDDFVEFDVMGTGDRKVWRATLTLFDERGKLRTGLQRVPLRRPSRSGIFDDDDNGEKGRFRDGGNFDFDDDDERWKASLILDALDRTYRRPDGVVGANGTSSATPGSTPPASSTTSARGAGGFAAAGARGATAAARTDPAGSTSAAGGAVGGGGIPPGGVAPVPWLDALTRARCEEILSEPTAEEEDVLGGGGGGAPVRPAAAPPLPPDHRTSSSSAPCLVVELPTFAVPIVHEEAFYPPSLHGASGSTTVLEISAHHKRLAALERQAALAAASDAPSSSSSPPPAATAIPFTNPRTLRVSDDADATCPSLVQIYDPEDEDDNPAEDKYRALAHDLLRGLVDPALKPDRFQRARLASIIASPSHHPTREEKDLLWRFRFSLVDNRRALTKFLLAVDWTVESEVVQAAELLEQWRKRSPIEVTDALKLLGKHVAFQTSLVRAYAIDTLAAAPDEELRLYLLQLVQALKYEDARSGHGGGADAESSRRFASTAASAGATPGAVSSLASFLIDRASKNLELANYLYWYLKVELQDPTHGARYREVFSAFEDKLSTERDDRKSPTRGLSSPSDGPISPRSPLRNNTMWDTLLAQDMFVSGVMDCQTKARDARGKKDAKESQLREALSSRGLERIDHGGVSVPLPSAPHVMITGAKPETARMFKSALYPAVIEFTMDASSSRCDRTDAERSLASSTSREDRTGDGTPNASPGPPRHRAGSTYKVIVKTGDDLRQDQLVIMMIQLMDGLLKRGTLDLCLKPYSIIATSQSSGLVEFVGGSIPISQILGSFNNSIMNFFRSVAPSPGSKYGVQPDVMQTYIRSCAGYCVITFILGVGDRHLDNIMLLPSGHFFHIDFGFIFGRDPKPLPPAFRLTREMVDGMGGVDSLEYRQFCSLACQAYNVLRKSAGLVLNLLHLMSDAGIEDLSNNPASDAEGVISKVEERFRLELTDEQAEHFFLGLINDSLAALAPRVMDVFHQLSVARR